MCLYAYFLFTARDKQIYHYNNTITNNLDRLNKAKLQRKIIDINNKVDNKLLSFAKIIKLSKKGKGKRIKTYLIMS